jgi:predicted chitinase
MTDVAAWTEEAFKPLTEKLDMLTAYLKEREQNQQQINTFVNQYSTQVEAIIAEHPQISDSVRILLRESAAMLDEPLLLVADGNNEAALGAILAVDNAKRLIEKVSQGLQSGSDSSNSKTSPIPGIVTTIGKDTLKTDKVFIVSGQSLRVGIQNKQNSPEELRCRVSVIAEGSNTATLNPTDDWKIVGSSETWVLELSPFVEGKYTISYKTPNKEDKIEFYVRKEAYKYSCSVCGRNLKLNADDLNVFFPKSKVVAEDANALEYINQALEKGGFNTCHRQAHFLSQIYVESGGMNAKVEGGQYSVKRLLEVYVNKKSTRSVFFTQAFWDDKIYLKYATKELYESSGDSTVIKFDGRDFATFKWSKKTELDTVRIPASFVKLKKGQYKKVVLMEEDKDKSRQSLFNLVYSNENGNGNINSGDGYKYRGRGAIQLTGRVTYRDVSKVCNTIFGTSYDWESNPDQLITDTRAIIYSVSGFFLWKLGSLKKLDTKDVKYVTKLVNGGDHGLDMRMRKFDELLAARLNNCKLKTK